MPASMGSNGHWRKIGHTSLVFCGRPFGLSRKRPPRANSDYWPFGPDPNGSRGSRKSRVFTRNSLPAVRQTRQQFSSARLLPEPSDQSTCIKVENVINICATLTRLRQDGEPRPPCRSSRINPIDILQHIAVHQTDKFEKLGWATLFVAVATQLLTSSAAAQESVRPSPPSLVVTPLSGMAGVWSARRTVLAGRFSISCKRIKRHRPVRHYYSVMAHGQFKVRHCRHERRCNHADCEPNGNAVTAGHL